MKKLNFAKLVVPMFTLLIPALLNAQNWIARHNLTAAQLQAEHNTNTANGYRIISLGGYVEGGLEKYIAHWEQIAGVPLIMRFGLSATDYQNETNQYVAQGYRTISVTGHVLGSTTKFSAIFIKDGTLSWASRHDLTSAQYQTTVQNFAAQGLKVKHVSGYVVNGVEYFAATWEPANGKSWVARHNLNATDFQAAANQYASQGFELKMMSGYNKAGIDYYAGVWETASNPHWSARSGLTGINYQNEFDNHYYQGYKPQFVSAFASGSIARFNGIFVNAAMTAADINRIDAAVNNYRTAQGINGVSLAVCKSGRLVFAKSYGLANNSTGELLSPKHSMRVMSISKPVTAAGILRMLQNGQLTLDQKVFGPASLLGAYYATPSGKPLLNNITVRQLLNHTSGLRTCNGEAVFHTASSTPDQAMNVLLQSADILPYTPGTVYNYANTNYFILERIIEKVSGLKYETYIRNNIFNSCGIGSSMFVGNANASSAPGEVSYTMTIPNDINLQLFGGFGGWVARPMDLLKFLNRVDGNASPSDFLTAATQTTMTTGSAQNPSYGLGWLISGSLQQHDGCFWGTRSFLVEGTNGISFAVATNSSPTGSLCDNGLRDALQTALGQVTAFPPYNLFDNIGTGARFSNNIAAASIANQPLSEDKTVSLGNNPITNGTITPSNYNLINSVSITNTVGQTEYYKNPTIINTRLKGALVIRITTKNGNIIVKKLIAL